MNIFLNKPYTEKERADFIVEYNHNNGLRIEETDKAIFALKSYEIIKDGEPYDRRNDEDYIAEQAQKERERIDNLTIPRTDLFKAIYLSKGLTPETIRSTIESIEDEQTRVIALIDFDNAKTFYRKHDLFSDFALSLGFTSIDIDNIFIQANNLT